MSHSSSTCGHVTNIFGILIVASLLAGLAASRAGDAPTGAPAAPQPTPATTEPSAATKKAVEDWRRAMLKAPRPKPKGCFTVAYPKTEWQEVPCTTPLDDPYPPAHGPHPQVVGYGVDFSAQATGTLSSAEGSFDQISNVTSETGRKDADNNWSLQLNSNYFTTPLCSGAADPTQCQGWEQFVYANRGKLAVQYWLLNYGTCLLGWTTQGNDCWMSSDTVAVPRQPLSNLGNMILTGTASNGGNDVVTLFDGNTLYTTNGSDDVLKLASSWQIAEYNVFGDCCLSQANFNVGSNIIVRTNVNNGTQEAPTLVERGFTGETNNFTLVPPACLYSSPSPALVFDESTNVGATSMCANGTSIGDTHLTNINGLLYDFQAAGDYLLAQTDREFVVQTRQVSGAPTWPNTSVNKAVAMNMGSARLAVCLDPNRLVVDGKPVDLADGKSLWLLGVSVVRTGSTYAFTRPNGANVRAELNSGYINVSVGLGRTPVALVQGLLGNANGNTGVDELATRSGVVLRQPVSFADLYQSYGDSWRVPADESLPAQLCGATQVVSGNPAAPFYANNLDPADLERARGVCGAAGVKDGALLDACTLDVTVLGDKRAAEVFVRAQPPRGVVRPESPRSAR